MPTRARATLDRTVDEMLPHMPAGAISAAARCRLQSVARWLPAELTNLVYFECRLGQSCGPVDMILCVEEPGHSLLATHAWRPRGGDALHISEPWQRLERWSGRWRTPDQRPSSAGVSHVLWIEFDVDEQAAAAAATRLPTPSVFVGFAPKVVRRDTSASALAAALGGCAPIVDDATAAHLCRALPNVLRALPDAAHVEYLGMMMSRPGSPVRICFSHFTWSAVWEFAAAIGCPDDPALRSAVRGANSLGPGVVHIDLAAAADAVCPSLGLECILDRRSQVFGSLPNRPFFDALVADGVIPAVTCDDLAAWPGCSRSVFAHQLWPTVLSRRVNHVKVVGQPGGRPLAKAYLCGGHRYLARAGRPITGMASPTVSTTGLV